MDQKTFQTVNISTAFINNTKQYHVLSIMLENREHVIDNVESFVN